MADPEFHSRLSDQHVPRPFRVTLLALVVLSIAVLGLLRLVQAIREWSFLSGLLTVPPYYLALTGLGWGTVGLVLAIGLWLGRPWAARLTRIASLAYGLYFWLDRLLLVNPAIWQTNLFFTAAATLILLIFVFGILSSRKVRAFFGEIYVY